MEQFIIYSAGIIFVGWSVSISIQVIKLFGLWLKYKILNLKELIK